MSPTMSDRIAAVQPQSLRLESEGDRKQFADPREAVGQLVERALELMGVTKQEAAFAMGYSDSGVVSRWCTGADRPLFDKLFGLRSPRASTLPSPFDRFDTAWIFAIAERHPRLEVITQLVLRHVRR